MLRMITNSLYDVSSEIHICAKARKYSGCLKVVGCKYVAVYYKKNIKKFLFFVVLLFV